MQPRRCIGPLPLLFVLAFAQAPTGEIAGAVYDASDGVVPNASVAVKNAATAFERMLRSNQVGQYRVASLAAGTYEITVEAPGFRALDVTAVVSTGTVTTVTVDGAGINDIATGGPEQNFSQEIVHEFQISSVNFDPATGIAAGGAINIVTRTGGNQLHGSGFFSFRDHHAAAFPELNRDPLAPDPFFARRQSGLWAGGPSSRTASSPPPKRPGLLQLGAGHVQPQARQPAQRIHERDSGMAGPLPRTGEVEDVVPLVDSHRSWSARRVLAPGRPVLVGRVARVRQGRKVGSWP